MAMYWLTRKEEAEEGMTQLEQLSTEELIGLIYREPDYWTADSLAVELAKRLSEASKALDELAGLVTRANPAIGNAYVGKRKFTGITVTDYDHPHLHAQIAKRKK